MKKLDIINEIIKKEFLYLYKNKVVFLDIYNKNINKENCSGTILTTINSCNNYYIIEVEDE